MSTENKKARKAVMPATSRMLATARTALSARRPAIFF
jgi:hypothetical protein